MTENTESTVHRSLSSSATVSGGFEPILDGKSPSRCFLNAIAAEIDIDYPLLDIGGSSQYSYYRAMEIDDTRTVSVNLPRESEATVFANVEQSLPFVDGAFPTILCFNLLEHLYQYKTAIRESYRVLAPGGRAHFFVPFFQRIHGDPYDFTRFTPARLRRELLDAGYTAVSVDTLDPGPLSTAADTMLPVLKRDQLKFLVWRLANIADTIVHRINDVLDERHPLCLFATGRKEPEREG